MKNFEVLINEITNSPCRVYICIVSVYLFIYLSIYLSTYLYLDMYASVSLFIILSLPIYDHNKTIFFSDWTVEALAKTKYTLFWKWCHFMVGLYFNWHFFVTSKVYIITIKLHNFQGEYRWRFGKNGEVIHSENYVILLWNINYYF